MEDTPGTKPANSNGSTTSSPGREKTFMCGVVEGFYGRPWTTEQRLELFHRMKKFGMNTYMYAPKDDTKHRASWREPYSVEEIERLSMLISEAKACDITFVYAISPGLDITFSSPKDMALLKTKLDQMVRSGCTAFALLFDDIELEMSSSDKEVFQSLAHAEVAVTNEVYEYLGQPATFLFCPTEYCASRAVPEVSKSPYLATVGSRLMRNIDVMWTGPRVVSRNITAASLDELNAVLCRRTVIWDNIHANDYDHRRVFLGPYGGRSGDVASRLNGVLTNPNCEFEANYVALHTLGTWSRSALRSPSEAPEPRVTDADIRLEVGDDAAAESLPYPWSYSLKQALITAAADWLIEFNKKTLPPASARQGGPLPPLPLLSTPASGPTSIAEGDGDRSAVEQPDGLDPVIEPMDVALDAVAVASNGNGGPYAAAAAVDAAAAESGTGETGSASTGSEDAERSFKCTVTVDDILLLCDMMHTPFEYGPQSTAMLGEFHWLKASGRHVAGKLADKDEAIAAEWRSRADKLRDWVRSVVQTVDKLCNMPNRAILHELYPYVWEIRSVLNVVAAFVEWLGLLGSSEDLYLPTSSDSRPPITHKGGLTAEFERMLPLYQANDLFPHKPPSLPPSHHQAAFTVRPYRAADEAAVYEVCRKTCDDGADGSHVFVQYPDAIGDKLVGDLLTLSPHLCFVLEDSVGKVCGYALGAKDVLEHRRKVGIAWTPAMREKYPALLPNSSAEESLSPEVEVVLSLCNPQRSAVQHGTDAATGALAEASELKARYPSLVRVAALQQVLSADAAAPKRLMATLLAALKACGSPGAHCEIQSGEDDTLEFYNLLGFVSFQQISSLGHSTAPAAGAADEAFVCVRAL